MDQEKRFSDNSFFVTLTYEDNELVYADDEPCLYKRHLQLYFKRLRKFLHPGKIKYYCVGEYGEQWRPITPNGRPHYHALVFYRGDLDWFDLRIKLKEFWPHGIAQVLPVQGAQGYVTKYVLKFDSREHKVKPFSLISHGLGIDYLSLQMISYHKSSLLGYAVKPGGYKVSLPRYYKDKIFSPYDRLIMKVRSDIYRRDLEIKKFDAFFYLERLGINPFAKISENYQLRLFNSLKLYRQKHKL